MKREELLNEIARLDDEINRTIASTALPTLVVRSFPLNLWVLTAMCFAWWQYGYLIPGAYVYHMESQQYVFYVGVVVGAWAFISTLRWMFKGRGYQEKSEAYTDASRRARELQERRRELQAELRAISKD